MSQYRQQKELCHHETEALTSNHKYLVPGALVYDLPITRMMTYPSQRQKYVCSADKHYKDHKKREKRIAATCKKCSLPS